jgi:cytochrome c biogenesis protein
MTTMKRFFLSRKTILTLIVLILGAIAAGYIFPQSFSTSPDEIEKWQEGHPFLALWAKTLGLHHVYSTSWFAILLFLFMVSLTISTVEQIKKSSKKTFGEGVGQGGNKTTTKVPPEELKKIIKNAGYMKVAEKDTLIRFVKYPWGYWGSALLHLGIMIVIGSSLLIVLTQKRGLLNLVEGETFVPGSPWFVEENGVLAGRFVTPEAVKLEKVNPEFWETDELKQLSTEVSFIDIQGGIKKNVLAVNQTIDYRGLRIYQSHSFGNAFFVEFGDGGGGKRGVILQLENPTARDKASYGNFNFEEMPYLVKAKYFADAEKKSMESANPLLVMRLVDKGTTLGELPLRIGEEGQIGSYTVKLVKGSKWAGLIFVDITGMEGIFFGFFIIIVGSGLTYFMTPREIYLKGEGDQTHLTWKASRFEDVYKGEFDIIKGALERLQRG